LRIKPTIYFFCPEVQKPVGSVQVIYNHVDLLNAHGFSACVLHSSPGFRCNWFPNKTVVKSSHAVEFQADDVLVVPETWVQFIKGKNWGIKKVIFNQNAYFTFSGGADKWNPEESPYLEKDTIAAFVVSEDNHAYLSYVFPNLAIHRVHNVIDPSLFYYAQEKKNQLCYMPRKGVEFSSQILACLRYRGALKNWDIVAIDDMGPEQVAQVMRESKIFLSFGYPEGFSLPPAEAMACGCVVIGYHGMGGREFFRPEFSYPVELGDIIGYAQTIESVTALAENDSEAFKAKGAHAARFIAETYTPEVQKKDILDFWQDVISVAPTGAPDAPVSQKEI